MFVRAVGVSRQIGLQVVVVHAIDEVAALFYRSTGFRPFDADPMKLYLPVRDVQKTLDEVGITYVPQMYTVEGGGTP